MSRPVPNAGILDIAPYTPGKSPKPESGRKVFKLSANETPFGPSPKAIEAYINAAAHLQDYPESTSRILREAIGRAFGLDPDRIICGAGSDELLNLLAHAYLDRGDEAISTTHGFLVYPIATMANGAVNVVAPETNYTADVDAILKLVTPRTKLVWLANPNNPTGTYVPFDEVKRLRAGLPSHTLLSPLNVGTTLNGAEFKKQMREGTPKMGLFVNSHSPTVAEQLAHTGYDWLLVDTQHGPMDHEKLSAMLCAISSGGAKSILLRMPS